MGHKTLTRKIIDFPYYRMYPTNILKNQEKWFFWEIPLPLDTIMLVNLAKHWFSPKPSNLLDKSFYSIPNLKLLFNKIIHWNFWKDIEKKVQTRTIKYLKPSSKN